MFVDVAALADLPEGQGLSVVVDGEPVLLVRAGDRVFATAGLCSHEDQSLAGGTLLGPSEWQCPHHGGALDLATGRPTRMPVCASIPTFPVRVESGRVFVDVD